MSKKKAASYFKIGPEHGSYSACIVARQQGRFMCDAVNHGQAGGCPNPECWLHRPDAPDRQEVGR